MKRKSSVNNFWLSFPLGALALGGFVFSFFSGTEQTLPAAQAMISPAWELKDLQGQTVRSSDFKGQVLVLDFWATWCPPCRAEVPNLIALEKKFGSQGLKVVSISLDEAGPEAVKKFVKKLGISYRVLMSNDKVLESFGGISAIPAAFIIDRTGRIVQQHIGFVTEAELEEEIKPLLGI